MKVKVVTYWDLGTGTEFDEMPRAKAAISALITSPDFRESLERFGMKMEFAEVSEVQTIKLKKKKK